MKTQRNEPRFSIISAGRNVAPFLAAHMAGIEDQGFPQDEVEVLVVDTGSTDGTLAALRDWARGSRYRVSIESRPGMGRAAAMNLALEQASGDWLTFPDLRDRWHRRYLAPVATFQARRPNVELLSGRPIEIAEGRPDVRPRRPRAWQYELKRRVFDLDSQPNVFPFPTASFVRRESVISQKLAFEDGLEPFFETAHFLARYLLGLEKPTIGLVAGARYLQTWIASTDQEMAKAYEDPSLYTTVLERGYLDLLERGRTSDGPARAWIQQLVIYELGQRYFREAEAFSSRLTVPAPIEHRFHELLGAIAARLEPDQVFAHTASRFDPVWADVLVRGYRSGRWVAQTAELTDVDTSMGLQRITYRFHGDPPTEAVEVDGQAVEPAFGKRRSLSFFGRTTLVERIAWVPAGEVRLRLDGEAVAVGPRAVPPERRGRRGGLRRRMVAFAKALRGNVPKVLYRLAAILYRPRFGNAWVLIDRVHDAGDNGQRLFEYLRRERRDINAWFVIERGTPHWTRLARRRRRRLVAYGSFRWKMLMLNAAWLLSSHTDESTIINPVGLRRLFSRPPWKYAFLQHGVVHRDLSRWFNKRHIDLLVTSTPTERESIAGNDTPYTLTTKETRETGLPRFDRLRTLSASLPVDDRDLVVVAPTWRTWLTLPSLPGKQRRPVHDAFWTSDYLTRWLEVLRDPQVAAAASARGWRVAFMPHPNFQAVLSEVDIPEHVKRFSFARHDVQRVYARCALLITDYSSVAFDAAYIDRPVVYFHFDRDDLETGRHHGRSGYFDFERDGFGPVARHHSELVGFILESIARGPTPAPEYQARIDRTFPLRDGGACARVVAAVEELSRAWIPPLQDAALGARIAHPGEAIPGPQPDGGE